MEQHRSFDKVVYPPPSQPRVPLVSAEPASLAWHMAFQIVTLLPPHLLPHTKERSSLVDCQVDPRHQRLYSHHPSLGKVAVIHGPVDPIACAFVLYGTTPRYTAIRPRSMTLGTLKAICGKLFFNLVTFLQLGRKALMLFKT
jgi:hypothetical protein